MTRSEHIRALLEDYASQRSADEADIFYYSPTKDYLLFYNVRGGGDSVSAFLL